MVDTLEWSAWNLGWAVWNFWASLNFWDPMGTFGGPIGSLGGLAGLWAVRLKCSPVRPSRGEGGSVHVGSVSCGIMVGVSVVDLLLIFNSGDHLKRLSKGPGPPGADGFRDCATIKAPRSLKPAQTC